VFVRRHTTCGADHVPAADLIAMKARATNSLPCLVLRGAEAVAQVATTLWSRRTATSHAVEPGSRWGGDQEAAAAAEQTDSAATAAMSAARPRVPASDITRPCPTRAPRVKPMQRNLAGG
jgi:hypothetical protein